MDFCCGLGNKTDPNKRNCYRRTMDLNIEILKEQQLIDDCKNKFFNCCVNAFGLKGMIKHQVCNLKLFEYWVFRFSL
jgi:hypothetical protein